MTQTLKAQAKAATPEPVAILLKHLGAQIAYNIAHPRSDDLGRGYSPYYVVGRTPYLGDPERRFSSIVRESLGWSDIQDYYALCAYAAREGHVVEAWRRHGKALTLPQYAENGTASVIKAPAHPEHDAFRESIQALRPTAKV